MLNTEHTNYIVQKYIENPLLVNNRKFDIRCYGLITIINGRVQGYFYQEGYIRTASEEFSLCPPYSRYIHLTNDAVQKHSENYSRFETGNKLSYSELQKYFDRVGVELSIAQDITPQIRTVVSDTFKAVYEKIDPQRKLNTFELFGYDFMIDSDFKVWLIEANTNPCLELSCPFLSTFIPALLDNTLLLTIDPLFPPPLNSKKLFNWLTEKYLRNRFELVFSESNPLN